MNKKRKSIKSIEDCIEFLLDENTFLPQSSSNNENDFGREIITGIGKIAGKNIAIWATNSDVNKGYITKEGSEKIVRLMDRALELGIPVVSLLSSAGIAIENVLHGEAFTKVMAKHVDLSGKVPQFACVLGVNIGAPAYSATLQDIVVFNRLRSHLCVSGPGVVKEVLGEDATFSSLGSSSLHSTKTGIAHFVEKNIEAQLSKIQELVAYFPENYIEDPQVFDTRKPLKAMIAVPSDPASAFDMSEFIEGLVDGSEQNEFLKMFGESAITSFCYIGGYPVGIIGNQSLVNAGALDYEATTKMSKFIDLCNSFNIPILTLIDAPGFMPGIAQETKGILEAGAKLIKSMQTKVPRLSVVVRKCYGASAIVLSQTQAWGGDLVLALPTARNAVMGFEAAKNIIYSKEDLNDEELKKKHFEENERPEVSFKLGLVDEIVEPDNLRGRLISYLSLLKEKRDNV